MESQDELLGVFSEAVAVTFREMAGAESFVRDCSVVSRDTGYADVSAILRLDSGRPGFLVLSFPQKTLDVLAQRILAESVDQLDAIMRRDCAGEVANVVAGQAKTLLFGTPHHYTFSTPLVVVGVPPEAGAERLLVSFESEVGAFTLHLCLA